MASTGASIFSRGTLITNNCTFENNTAVHVGTSNPSVQGGAVYVESSGRVILTNTIFRSNNAM